MFVKFNMNAGWIDSGECILLRDRVYQSLGLYYAQFSNGCDIIATLRSCPDGTRRVCLFDHELGVELPSTGFVDLRFDTLVYVVRSYRIDVALLYQDSRFTTKKYDIGVLEFSPNGQFLLNGLVITDTASRRNFLKAELLLCGT